MARLFFLEGGKKEGKVRAQCSLGRAIWWKEEEDVGGLRMEGGVGWVEQQKRYQRSVYTTGKHQAFGDFALQQFGSVAPSSHPLYGNLSECCGRKYRGGAGGGPGRGGIRPIRLTHETS